VLIKLKGIIFRCIPYGDSSVILQVFTDELGLQSYLVQSARKAGSKISPGALQVLHQVEIIAGHKNTGEIHRVKEIKNYPHYQDIPFNVLKASLILFLDEVLIKSIRQHQKDPALFEFLKNSFLWLDICSLGIKNFHILFLLQLSRYLGFFPSLENAIEPEFDSERSKFYFDMKNGSFTEEAPLHPGYVAMPVSGYIFRLSFLRFEEGESFAMGKNMRMKVLHTLLDFYAFQVEGFGHIKSLDILSQVFDEKD